MANKKYLVELTVDERVHLSELIKKGKSSAQSNLKARILLKADQGDTGEHWLDKDICTALDTNMSMVGRVRETFVNEGFEAVFTRKKRETPPITPIFDGEAEARLIALACSEPPLGPGQTHEIFIQENYGINSPNTGDKRGEFVKSGPDQSPIGIFWPYRPSVQGIGAFMRLPCHWARFAGRYASLLTRLWNWRSSKKHISTRWVGFSKKRTQTSPQSILGNSTQTECSFCGHYGGCTGRLHETP